LSQRMRGSLFPWHSGGMGNLTSPLQWPCYLRDPFGSWRGR
jgi:hypothetical protein